MTAEEQGLLQDVIENPEDDSPRLIYADWCEDHGRHDRAEFIRLQLRLATRPVWWRFTGGRIEVSEAGDWLDVGEYGKPAHFLPARPEATLTLPGLLSNLRVGDVVSAYDAETRYGPTSWTGVAAAINYDLMLHRTATSIRLRGPIPPVGDCCRPEDREREAALSAGDSVAPWPGMPTVTTRQAWDAAAVSCVLLRRGFAEMVSCGMADWRRHGPRVAKASPLNFVLIRDARPDRAVGAGNSVRYAWRIDHLHAIGAPGFRPVYTHATHKVALSALSIACIDWARSTSSNNQHFNV